MVRWEPEAFICPIHPKVDLTPQVAEQMEELGPPVAYDPRRLLGRRSRHTDFEVVVLCPGDGSEGSGHEQPLVGKVWP
jgi:hypothetical protein